MTSTLTLAGNICSFAATQPGRKSSVIMVPMRTVRALAPVPAPEPAADPDTAPLLVHPASVMAPRAPAPARKPRRVGQGLVGCTVIAIASCVVVAYHSSRQSMYVSLARRAWAV